MLAVASAPSNWLSWLSHAVCVYSPCLSACMLVWKRLLRQIIRLEFDLEKIWSRVCLLQPLKQSSRIKDQGWHWCHIPGKNRQVNHEVYLFCKLDCRETHGIKEIYELHIIWSHVCGSNKAECILMTPASLSDVICIPLVSASVSAFLLFAGRNRS